MWKSTAIISFLLFFPLASAASDNLTATQTLSVSQTLISAGNYYEFGFFAAAAGNYYLGIWYYNLLPRTIVWVANRDSPAWGASVNLRLDPGGRIILSEDGRSETIQSSNESTANPVLQILDTGNLVVREADATSDYTWQSFNHPTDTLLPGQKLDKDRYITSWTSTSDPSTGNYSFRLDPTGDPEVFLLDRVGPGQEKKLYRSGPWVGQRFSGVPEMKPSTDLNFTFHYGVEPFYLFDLVDPSIKSRLMVDSFGKLNRYTWVPDRRTWNLFWDAPKDQCDNYEECGPYGLCNAGDLFVCGCPQGFDPKNPAAWKLRYGSDGCVRRTKLQCGGGDGFALLKEMKLPESGAAVVHAVKGIDECGKLCKADCNCTAYASKTVVLGVESGCVTWSGALVDMRSYSQGGQDLYVRVAASDLNGGSSKTKKALIGVGISVAGIALLVAGYFVWKKHQSSGEIISDQRIDAALMPRATQRSHNSSTVIQSKTGDLELPLYDFDAMLAATNSFSEDNKLGQGGFGRVYKGVLVEGHEVAIKRLSKESGQGVEEFKNEVILIAKLQHRNLVRLLGCCVDRDEKMLIYEYLPNRSLDSVLFHKDRRKLLDWKTRFNIICGIARGLLYLHHDSRLRIIHRDLKASNILLDGDMHPKISDFGMARIFGEDETESNNTRRVVGTYGYMAPEYAMDGLFSIKSDVFSFGVLMLEIITGKKNRGFYNTNHEASLLGYAWKMWREGKGTQVLDPSMGESYSEPEALRCIQVGLLCVQERAEERPTMSQAILLLSSETASLPQPKHPGFCLESRPGETESSTSRQDESCTINQVTVTMLDGR